MVRVAHRGVLEQILAEHREHSHRQHWMAGEPQHPSSELQDRMLQLLHTDEGKALSLDKDKNALHFLVTSLQR